MRVALAQRLLACEPSSELLLGILPVRPLLPPPSSVPPSFPPPALSRSPRLSNLTGALTPTGFAPPALRHLHGLLSVAEDEFEALREHAQAWLTEGIPLEWPSRLSPSLVFEACQLMRQHLREHNSQLRQHNNVLRNSLPSASSMPLVGPTAAAQTMQLLDPLLMTRIPCPATHDHSSADALMTNSKAVLPPGC